MSKEQDYLYTKIREIIPPKFTHYKNNLRPDILRNPKTDKNLEIDIFLTGFNVGIEYQGGVHFNYIERFRNDVDSIRERDTLKSDLALQNRLSIVEIFSVDLDNNFFDNFIKRIQNTSDFYFLQNKLSHVKRLQILKIAILHHAGIKFGHVPLIDFKQDMGFMKELLESKYQAKEKSYGFAKKKLAIKYKTFLNEDLLNNYINKHIRMSTIAGTSDFIIGLL